MALMATGAISHHMATHPSAATLTFTMQEASRLQTQLLPTLPLPERQTSFHPATQSHQ